MAVILDDFREIEKRGLKHRQIAEIRTLLAPAWLDMALFACNTKLGILSPMSNNTSFSLGDHFAAFIETEVARGRYASASDVVRAGLHLLEEQEARLKALQAALIEGEESGASGEFDFEKFIERKRENNKGGK